METNPKIFFLTADMGINLIEKISERFPDRYLNVGIAEQNAIGVAAGLAESGYVPYVYSISNFISLRAYEQIRNDITLHKLKVNLFGTSTGYDNGPLGPTHHMLDDCGVLTSLPNIQIFCPFNLDTIQEVFNFALDSELSSFIRIPKGAGCLPPSNNFTRQQFTNQGVVISYGSALPLASKVATSKKYDLCAIYKLHPLEKEELIAKFEHANEIIVVEDHFSTTGLYSSICQLLVESRLHVKVGFVGPKSFSKKVGTHLEDFIDSSEFLT
jgi:transketolase